MWKRGERRRRSSSVFAPPSSMIKGGYVVAQVNVPRVRVRLLGSLRLEIDGVQVDTHAWKSKKALTLFKLLAARCGERFPKDVLIELLWPESDDVERSIHNLHTVVYYLRRELQPNLGRYEPSKLLRHAGGLHWLEKGPTVWVDVDEFRRLAWQGDRLGADNGQGALRYYRRALHLYRDDFSPEDLYEDWAATLREHLRERYVEVVMATAELIDRLDGDRLYAISICRKALQREPYREELHRMLMVHLIKAGFYPEAVTQFRECERLLYEEFGLRPSPETQAVYEQLQTKRAESQALSMSGAVAVGKSKLGDVADGSNTAFDQFGGGPLFCNRQTYNVLHKVELRRQTRTGQPFTLLRISLDSDVAADASERKLCLRVLKQSLRAGEVFCWETPNQIVAQLSNTDEVGLCRCKAVYSAVWSRLGHCFLTFVLQSLRTVTSAVTTDGGRVPALDCFITWAGDGPEWRDVFSFIVSPGASKSKRPSHGVESPGRCDRWPICRK